MQENLMMGTSLISWMICQQVAQFHFFVRLRLLIYQNQSKERVGWPFSILISDDSSKQTKKESCQ